LTVLQILLRRSPDASGTSLAQSAIGSMGGKDATHAGQALPIRTGSDADGFAKRAAIAWGRLSAIENGVAEAHPDELTRIAAALQVPIEALLEPLAVAPRAQTPEPRISRIGSPASVRSVVSLPRGMSNSAPHP
jgi:hypothetical protein